MGGSQADARPVLCVDIGGSGIKAAAITADGTFTRLPETPTPGALPELFEHFAGLVDAVPGCRGIAVSAPGAIDIDALRVHGSSAVPYIHDNDWPDVLSARTGLPLTMENDANCAGLAEVWYGSSSTPRTICTVVIGTGVGGSVIIDGRVQRGTHSHGGEFGYWAFTDPDEGHLSSVSDTASTRALVNLVTEQAGGTWDGRRVFEAADAGDPVCLDVLERWYRRIALVVHTVQYAIDPEVILLGGGVSQRPTFLDELRHGLDWVYTELPFAKVHPQVGVCYFQADANLYGALAHFLLQAGELT